MTSETVPKKEGSPLPDPTRNLEDDPIQVLLACYSDWTRLKRRVVWLLRYTQFTKDKGKTKTGRLAIED